MSQVSIVVPTYNRKDPVQRAVKSAINQTYTEYEIIIVDDGSDDNTHENLGKFSSEDNIYYVYTQNRGANAARQLGINLSNGEYICFLDSDDILHPKHIEKVMCKIEQLDETYAGVFTGYKISKNNRIIRRSEPPDILTSVEDLSGQNRIGGFSVITLRKNALKQVGGVRQGLPALQDMELYIRLLSSYKLRGINCPLVVYDTTNQSISDNINKKLSAQSMLMELYPDDISNEFISNFFYTRGRLYSENNELLKGAVSFFRSFILDPSNLSSLIHFFSLIFGSLGYSALRYCADMTRHKR